MMLVGLEGQYSDLVSTTEAGYPFCQRVAQWSVGEGAEALHTRSARDDEGTCVPVFRRATLDNARALHRVRFWAHDEQIAHEIVPHT